MALIKKDIIQAVAESNRYSKRQAAEAIEALLEIIKRTLGAGEEISIRGFGRFCLMQRARRRGRNPATGDERTISPRRVVEFKSSAKLTQLLNTGEAGIGPAGEATVGIYERRAEPRHDDIPNGRAIVRVSGIPVCEFKIRDVSDNGTCFVVEENSMIMRNIRVGQEIDIRVDLTGDGSTSTVYQRSQIRHITRQREGWFKGKVLVGVKILGRLVG